MNEDAHLESEYELRHSTDSEEDYDVEDDFDEDEICEECEEHIDDCRCCTYCGSPDCDETCEDE